MPSILDEIDLIVDNGFLSASDTEEAPLNEQDKKWIREAMAAAIAKDRADNPILLPTKAERLLKGFKDWGAISALWAVPLGLIAIIVTLAIFGAGQQTTISNKLLGIGNDINGINARLDKIDAKIASQAVVSVSALPPEQFRAYLPSLTSALGTIRQQNIGLPTSIVSDLRQRLATTDTQAPGYWPAAAELVSYHPQEAGQDQKKNCLGRSLPQYPDSVPDPDAYVQLFKDCTLVIDDQQAYKADPGFQRFIAGMSTHLNVWSLELHLIRVHVVYRGGTLIPVTAFLFKDCTFELDLPTTPPDSGKQLVHELLTANLAKGTEVSFTPGA